MRGLVLISVLFALPLGIAAQNDVYYIPSKKVNEVTVSGKNGATSNKNYGNYDYQYSEETNAGSNRDVDEYNRRRSSTGRSSSDKEYAEDNPSLQSGVDGAENNFSCTKMIVRFHSPAGIIVSSPYYWDICYDNTWDVYLDAWAFGLPSWSYWTYAYDPWYYNRWWYRTCWDYTWGWYDPWWGYSYWGWGRPVYWGWDRPYYGYWGGGWYSHHWGYGGYAPGFQHVGGGRYFANGNETVRRGSAGGWIRQGSNTLGGVNAGGGRGYLGYRGGLSKSFRIDNSDNAMQTYERRGGGGFSNRSAGGSFSSRGFSRGTSRGSYNNPSTSKSGQTVYRGLSRGTSTERTYTPQQQTTPSRSYTPSNIGRGSSSGGSFGGGSRGGSFGGGTGGGRSGGGGFGGRR